jgi:hypothetical protein
MVTHYCVTVPAFGVADEPRWQSERRPAQSRHFVCTVEHEAAPLAE